MILLLIFMQVVISGIRQWPANQTTEVQHLAFDCSLSGGKAVDEKVRFIYEGVIGPGRNPAVRIGGPSNPNFKLLASKVETALSNKEDYSYLQVSFKVALGIGSKNLLMVHDTRYLGLKGRPVVLSSKMEPSSSIATLYPLKAFAVADRGPLQGLLMPIGKYPRAVGKGTCALNSSVAQVTP